MLIAVALFYFPEGLPSPRWRWPARYAIGAIAVFMVAFTLLVGVVPVAALQTDGRPQVTGWREGLLYFCFGCILALVPVAVAAVVSLVIRYRRGSAIERLQLRWMLAAGALTVLVELALFALNLLGGDNDTVQALIEPPAFALIAVAAGVAITRHGLYEIDRIVSRTVSYLVISAVLVAVYAAVVSVVALVIPDRYGDAGGGGAVRAAARPGAARGGPEVQPRPVRRGGDGRIVRGGGPSRAQPGRRARGAAARSPERGGSLHRHPLVGAAPHLTQNACRGLPSGTSNR